MNLFSVVGQVVPLYTNHVVGEYNVVPWSSCCPRHVAELHPQVNALQRLYIIKTGPEISVAKNMLMHKIKLTQPEAFNIAINMCLECNASTPLPEFVRLVMCSECGDDVELVDATCRFYSQLDDAGWSKSESECGGEYEGFDDCMLSDPLAECIFDELDPCNKDLFSDVKKAFSARSTRQRVAGIRFQRAAAKGRVRGGGRRRGRGSVEAAPSVEANPEESAPASSSSGPTVPSLTESTIEWGSFVIRKVKRLDKVQFNACCKYHPKVMSLSAGAGFLTCTRDITVGGGYGLGQNEEQTLRRLKEWCLAGTPGTSRRDHMKLLRYPVAPRDLPSDAELNERRSAWDPLPHAFDVV